jgi:hypothetical protein
MRNRKQKAGQGRSNNPLEQINMIGKEASRNDPAFAVLNPCGLKKEMAPTTLAPRCLSEKSRRSFAQGCSRGKGHL